MNRTNLHNRLSEDKNPSPGDNESFSSGRLIAVSIDLLYDGMPVHDDIYDASGERLLVKSGNTIEALQIERIKRLNSGSSQIYVTERTKQNMLFKRPNIDIAVRHEVEESTGYANIKDETLKCLDEISGDKPVNKESLENISNDLSEQIKTMPQDVLMFLINTMAPADEYLQRHSVNVGLLNGLAGRWLGMTETEIEKLVLVGLLHDCGKTILPAKILNAPRKLTMVEYEVIKTHTTHTYELLSGFPEDIRLAASCHHERTNGAGYARKMQKNDIPREARITAVSDTYDAFVSRRVYQKAQSPFNALALLKKLSSNELDPEVTAVFYENIPKDLINKPVTMSNGTIGIIREYDPEDISHPKVELSGKVIKCNSDLYCVSMFNDD